MARLKASADGLVVVSTQPGLFRFVTQRIGYGVEDLCFVKLRIRDV